MWHNVKTVKGEHVTEWPEALAVFDADEIGAFVVDFVFDHGRTPTVAEIIAAADAEVDRCVQAAGEPD